MELLDVLHKIAQIVLGIILLVGAFTVLFWLVLKLLNILRLKKLENNLHELYSNILDGIMTALQKTKIAIVVVLLFSVVVFAFKNYKSIEKPIQFENEKNRRYKVVIQKLKDIRKAQEAYRVKYERYTGNFDTLIHYVKTDSFDVVKAIGSIPDELLDSLPYLEAEAYAVKENLIRRDTVKIAIKDSLFSKGYPIDSLRYIPFTKRKEFELGAIDSLETGSQAKVPVFEAKALNTVILNGMDEKLIASLNAEQRKLKRYEGLKVGDLEKATNGAGNWE